MAATLGHPLQDYYRTLEDHLDAFMAAGWRLAKLADVPAARRDNLPLPPGSRFPFFTVLAFD